MKVLFGAGLLILVLGVVSLFVPIPRHEREGLKVGNVAIGITTEHDEKVPLAVSAGAIVAGSAIVIAALSRRG
jgi:hypothetical protein